jgi:hypothetical protein
MYKFLGRVALLILFLAAPSAFAQTAPDPSDPTTSDYLPAPVQLLFPSLPATYPVEEVLPPLFGSGATGFDIISLGAIPGPEGATGTPVTKTLNLKLTGGVKGRIFSSPSWLKPDPDRFVNIKGEGELKVNITVRRDAGQGAGILPGQTNWGHMRVVLNGAVFDYSAQLVVGTPAAVNKDSGDKVFNLYRQVLARLDKQGDVGAIIGTPLYPNAGQTALGLAVDYLGEKGYNGKMTEEDFALRVAEMLAEKDYNTDGWSGFKPEDILIGAPGWALGKKVK